MATVYSPETGFDFIVPDYRNYDYEKEQKRESDYVCLLSAHYRKVERGLGNRMELVGKLICTGVADGQAQYMVIRERPFQMVHLHLGDAYSAGSIWERGLRITDARRIIKSDEWMRTKWRETSLEESELIQLRESLSAALEHAEENPEEVVKAAEAGLERFRQVNYPEDHLSWYWAKGDALLLMHERGVDLGLVQPLKQ